jgi:16S rRNA (uracil1498-N3)-methyltransferase
VEDHVAHQIRVVLRMRPGTRFVVLDDRGWEYEIELIEFGKKQARGQVIEKRPASGEPQVQITLYQCLLKKDNFEWVLQKGTEIGVSRFVPVISQRTVIPDGERVRSNKLPRWERIIQEAAEQSRRGRCRSRRTCLV